MNETDFHLHAYCGTACSGQEHLHCQPQPHRLRCGGRWPTLAGAASTARPLPGPRRCRLRVAGCGLRVVLEMLLAAERTRQNGEPGQYVGDRVMKGLVLACQSLCAQAVGRLQPEG